MSIVSVESNEVTLIGSFVIDEQVIRALLPIHSLTLINEV